jgi:hypothetical protein
MTAIGTTTERLPDAVADGFLPLHKRALGVAFGVAAALVVFALTAIYIIRAPQGAPDLGLLRNYFAGYSVTWPGAFIGAAWAGFVGYVAGWFLAFLRNFVLATELMIVRARSELAQTRDFLDQI